MSEGERSDRPGGVRFSCEESRAGVASCQLELWTQLDQSRAPDVGVASVGFLCGSNPTPFPLLPLPTSVPLREYQVASSRRLMTPREGAGGSDKTSNSTEAMWVAATPVAFDAAAATEWTV